MTFMDLQNTNRPTSPIQISGQTRTFKDSVPKCTVLEYLHRFIDQMVAFQKSRVKYIYLFYIAFRKYIFAHKSSLNWLQYLAKAHAQLRSRQASSKLEYSKRRQYTKKLNEIIKSLFFFIFKSCWT